MPSTTTIEPLGAAGEAFKPKSLYNRGKYRLGAKVDARLVSLDTPLHSGEPVEIGARQSVRFQAGRKLLQQIQDGVTSDDEREEFPSYLTFESHLNQSFADNK